jgi:phthiocerol/phenolphthiocerol synthesis type-I polyketide synthase E
VSKGLAGTGLRPRLVLTSRRGPAPADAAAIAELEALGAQVRAVASDVTDPRSLARVLDVATARFGPINGVLHLAGLPGGGMLVRRGRADADRVCAPKIHGMLALANAFHQRPPLDFLVAFSSRSALAGMVGNGDYAAANAFLDAFAAAARAGDGPARRTLSVGWPAWHSVGMLAAPPAEPAAAPAEAPPTREYVAVLAASQRWELDEHRVDGRPVLPATGHLDLMLGAFRTVLDIPADRAILIEKAIFVQPLAAVQPTDVRVRFVESGDRHRFTIAARPAGSDDAWQDHTTGTVAAVPMPEGAARTVDVPAAIAELTERELPPIAMTTTRMFRLGPRWQSITRVWADGPTQIGRIAIPEAFRSDLDDHPLHPALLDMATAIMRDPERDGTRVPFMYRRFAVYAPLPAEFYSRIRRREENETSIVGDIELFTPDGRLLGEIEGFTMRRADRAAFAKAQPATAEPVAAPTPAAGERTGLAPEQGARLLVTLLAGRSPAHVLVRPHEQGRPVPLADSGNGVTPVAAPAAVLSAAAPEAAEPPSAPAPAAASLQDRLRELWTEVLGVDDFTNEADFFALGGDSMSAVQLVGRVRDVFRIELGIAAIFDSPSIDGLAGTLRQQGAR